jgi:hypothetical protein
MTGHVTHVRKPELYALASMILAPASSPVNLRNRLSPEAPAEEGADGAESYYHMPSRASNGRHEWVLSRLTKAEAGPGASTDL